MSENRSLSDHIIASSLPIENGHDECTRLNRRLVHLLRGVSGLKNAEGSDAKLQHVADVLIHPDFFSGCCLRLEEPDREPVQICNGRDETTQAAARRFFDELRFQIENGSRLVTSVNIEDAAADDVYWMALLPWHHGEETRVGSAGLIHRDETLNDPQILDLVSVFLSDAIRDIQSERKLKALKSDEARYRSIIDNVSDVIFRVDGDGRFTFVSRRVRELMGWTYRDFLGHNFLQYVSPRHVDRVRYALQEVLGGRSVRLDCDFVRSDGTELTVFISANPTTDGDVVTGGLGIARDVTEKRRLEDQIRESEQRYRALTENAYDAILLVDPETYKIVDVNPQAEKLTGFSRAELLKMSVIDLRKPGKADEVRARIEMVMCAGVGRFEDTPLVCKDGRDVFVDTAASVYELEGKRYYQAIMRDVSLQKQMNEALEQRVLELQILAEVSDALQSAVDLQSVMGIVLTGVTAGEGLGFNRAFIFSYDKINSEVRGEAGIGPRTAEEAGRIWGELAGKGLSEIVEERLHTFPAEADSSFEFARQFLIPLDDDENVFARAIRNRETLHIDRRKEDPHLPEAFLRLYGAEEFAIVPLVTRDDVMGLLLVDNLFTHHRIEEQDLHRLKLYANSAASAIERSRLLVSLERRLHELTLTNQDLKASRDRLIQTERLSAIGEVAANVAHEIRNPLTAIGGFARSVFASLPENDKNRNKIQVILEETDRLEHMLSSLLEFTRPAIPRFTDLDTNAFIMQTIHFMGAEIDTNLIHVVYELDPDIPRVWADGQQIRQVLLNVVRNALQEMRQGGVLTLSTWMKGEDVQITVRDTGPGISPENSEKIFEAFFTTKPAGSGLGLAVCAQIIRNHNGRIEAKSKLGEGAQFIISLPASHKPLDSY